MGALDFLFEGKPPPSTTTYGTTTQDLPKWLSDYTQGLITKANAIASEPYQTYGGPRLAGLTPDQQRSFDITRTGSGSYLPGMAAARGSAQGALTAAQPYISQAGRTFPGAAQEYMDPYIENVINRAGTLTQRQLSEKLLPQMAGVFGAGGQDARSSAYRREAERGLRDLTEGLHEQSLGALSQGYQQAGQMFGQDASRMGTLGQLVGNLSLEQGRTGGALEEQEQSLRLRDAAAQEAIGRAQQEDVQRSLDLAYQDFSEQRDYPRETVDWLSSVIRGTPTPRATTTTTTGPGDTFQPSPLAQVGSLATGIAGIWDLFKGGKKARGGRIRYNTGGYRKGGALRYAYA